MAERAESGVAERAELGAALADALMRGDGAAVAALGQQLRPPAPDVTAQALLGAALAWPGEDAAAALRATAAAIEGFELGDLVGASPPSRLARLFGAEPPMQRARRRQEEAAALLRPAEAALADGLARLDAGLARLAAARAAAAAQAEAVGALAHQAEAALAATAAMAATLRDRAGASFASAEASARLDAQRDAIAAQLHELGVGRVAAMQAVAAADQLASRDRVLATAIRKLRDEVLPRWQLQVAEAIALLSATGAAEALRGVGATVAADGGATMSQARGAALDAIAQCIAMVGATGADGATQGLPRLRS